MKTLHLHIGTGKTGSSSIQKTFSALEDHSIYFQYDKSLLQIINNIDDLIVRLNNTNCNHVVYSCEWLFKVDESIIDELSQKLKPFFSTKVVIYLRRQDELIVSAYQQSVKQKNNKCDSGSIGLPTDYYLARFSYYDICNKWAKYFGKKNTIIRVFSSEALKDGCAVKDIANIVGVPLKDSDIIYANKSVGMISFKLAYVLQQFKVRKSVYNEIVFNAPESPKALPDRKTAESFYQAYISSNQRLMEEFSIESKYPSLFSNDFSQYPISRSDLWDEDTANAAIIHLCTVFLAAKEEQLEESNIDKLKSMLKAYLLNFKRRLHRLIFVVRS